MDKPDKLHIGCGDVYLEGWINIDSASDRADLIHDMRNALPFDNNSVDFIYNEHFIEHLTVQQGLDALKDFHRVLKSGGVLRISTPDLDYIIFKYYFFWKRQQWLRHYKWIKTKAEMMNIAFREWDHQYLYNAEEIDRRLREAGFQNPHRRKLGKSPHPELRHLETRKDSKLIYEVIK